AAGACAAARRRKTAARHGKIARAKTGAHAPRACGSRAVACGRRRPGRGGRMKPLPREIAGRWTPGIVLKRDLFSTVERGRFATAGGEVEAVLRRIDEVPRWTLAVARHLFARERRALANAGQLGVAPPLLFAGREVLVRGWIDGV